MIQHHYNLVQGTDEWLKARRGILTASEMKKIITPSHLKVAENDTSRQHAYELAAHRVCDVLEPSFTSDDMIRGTMHEVYARRGYEERYAPVTQCGFITNDDCGFIIGYSPDGLVGDDGLIEVKCPRAKTQFETIIYNAMPKEHMLQVQTGMFVSGRKWCDFISFFGGMPLFVQRIERDEAIIGKIIEAAAVFNGRVELAVIEFRNRVEQFKFPMTDPVPAEEIFV